MEVKKNNSKQVIEDGTPLSKISKDLNSYIELYNLMSNIKVGKKVLHYPRLDTVLNVEEFIKNNSGEFKKKNLWKNLPKKMMYQTFCVVFEYLLESGKIAQDKEGKVAWIWNPKLAQKYLNNPELRAK